MPSIKPHVHVPYERIGEFKDIIYAEGFNVELYLSGGNLDSLDEQKTTELVEIVKPIPSLSIHGPFMDLSPGAVDQAVREASMGRFTRTMEVAARLSPKTVVFHSGYEKWKYALNMDIWLDRSLETWHALAPMAREAGIGIAIENIFEDTPHNLARLMKELDDPTFGICFDTGHCNLFTSVPQQEWFDALVPYIIELHLHDNDRTSDAHWPMGEGSFNFDGLFRMLKGKDVVYTLEAHNIEDVRKAMGRFEHFERTYLKEE
jgi:sugar phosphate isomerase/epimerase